MNTLKKLTFSALSLGLLVCATSSPVYAQSQNANLNVSMNVDFQCAIRTVSDVAFANYAGSTLSQTAVVQWQCTKKLNTSQTITVKFNCGANGNGAGLNCVSKMKNKNPDFADSYLDYKIYSNNGYTTEWPASGLALNYNGNGNATNTSVYVRIPAGQYNAKFGEYEDTLTTSIIF